MNKKSILIADRNKLLLEALEEIFKINNYQVRTAVDGSRAYTLAKTELPDLILCDLSVSGITGAELYTKLQSNSLTKNIPFIFLVTESSSIPYLRGHLGIPASRIVYKPFSVEHLLESTKATLIESTSTMHRCTAGSAF